MPPADPLTDEVARLYALPLDEFVAERNAAAKATRREGRKDDAAALAALRKPSVVESALNRTAHRDPATTRAWAEATRRADDAQSATIGGGDAAALRTAVAELRTATAAMVDAAVTTIGDEHKRDDLAAYLRALPVSAAAQVVAGVLGSAVLPEDDLFAGAPTPPRRAARAARAAPAAKPRVKAPRPATATPPPPPAPAPPPGPSARERQLARKVEQRRAALATATEELATVQRELDDAQRRHTKLELRRAAAADALRAAEAELASQADRS